MVVPYLLGPYYLVHVMVPCDVAVPSVDACPVHYHILVVVLDFDFHHSHLYVANVVLNDLMVLVNCQVVEAEYFFLAHDSYRLVVPEVPNFVDMVEIENVELHDFPSVDRDIAQARLACYLMMAVDPLVPDHNLLDIEAVVNNYLDVVIVNYFVTVVVAFVVHCNRDRYLVDNPLDSHRIHP
jgi:hypothetical protein